MDTGDIGNSATYVGKKAAWENLKSRGMIRFVAISNGRAAGRNFISNGIVDLAAGSPIKHLSQIAGTSERAAEIGYELEHILRAYGFGLA